jgi:hypothetical protein
LDRLTKLDEKLVHPQTNRTIDFSNQRENSTFGKKQTPNEQLEES